MSGIIFSIRNLDKIRHEEGKHVLIALSLAICGSGLDECGYNIIDKATNHLKSAI